VGPHRSSGEVPDLATVAGAQTSLNWLQRATTGDVCPVEVAPPLATHRMAPTATATHELVFRQRTCNGTTCLVVFFICQHCDRGHRYCSASCREQARHRQRRAANRRHQQSEEGRLDHRDRQRQYRLRCRDGNNPEQTPESSTGVTDQGSPTIPFSGKIQPWEQPTPVRCRICGRTGRLVNTFPRNSWIREMERHRRL